MTEITRRHLLRRASVAALGSCLPAFLAAQEQNQQSRVRITKVETFRIRIPPEAGQPPDPFRIYAYPVNRVHTDSGIVGTSFVRGDTELIERWAKPMLEGEDLFAVDRHLQRLQMQRGESGVQGWSGVEHAMWDAIGRAAGLPVARLLGGSRDRLKVYRTCVFPGKPDQSDVPYETQAEYAVRLKEAGYRAMKVRAWRPRPMDDVKMLAVVRQAVGEDFEIMFDRTAVRPGWVWDYDTALQVARGMERYNARWLEEPFDGHDLEGPARLAAEVDIPITGGELGKSIHQFLAFLTHKTYDVLQPDTRICGGILNARKISILAEAFHVPCIQHGTNGLALAGYIQAGCAMPNCDYQEMIGQPNLPEEQWSPALRILRTPHVFEIENGHVRLPDRPGLGLDIDQDAIEEYRVRA